MFLLISGRSFFKIKLLSNGSTNCRKSGKMFLCHNPIVNFNVPIRNYTKQIIKNVKEQKSFSSNDILEKIYSKRKGFFKETRSANTTQKRILLSMNQISRYFSECSKDSKDDKKENEHIFKQLRYGFHKNVEDAINKQIIIEFNAAYSYLAMACYFGRTTIAFKGVQKFYMTMFQEEIEHALTLIKYQQMRGGHVKLTPIKVGECAEGCSIRKSLEVALAMEVHVSDKLLELLAIAEQHDDVRTQDFVTTEFIQEQMQSIRNLGQLLIQTSKIGDSGIAEYLLDKQMMSASAHVEQEK